jgi:hypothetical protein
MIDSLKKKSIEEDLASPEQEKLRTVNSAESANLKYYKTQGRILEDKALMHKFLGVSIQSAKMNKSLIFHQYFQ